MIVGECCTTMNGLKYQACEERGGIPVLVGGVGKEGIQRAVVGGQHMGWWDQRHLVPTASILQEAAGAGNVTGGRMLMVTS